MTTAAKARIGVVGLFWLNGAAWSSIVPRYPEIKAYFELSNTWWGIVVALGPIGGLLAGLFTAGMMRKYTSATVAVAAQVVGIGMLLILGSSPWAWLFAVGLFLMACLDSITDIAMNAHGLRVQKLYQRSILNSFHGWWSIGAVSGGLLGAGAAQLGLPIFWQCVIGVVLFAAMSGYTHSLLLKGPDADLDAVLTRKQGHFNAPIIARLVALGLLGASVGAIEDMGASWSAVFMVETYAAVPFVAGLGFVALQGAQTIGRLLADRVVDRFGSQTTVVAGALLAGVGLGVSLLIGNQWVSLIGFGCAGLGIAATIPMAMHAGDELPHLKAGTGLTTVTWLMRVGFLLSPPLIGVLGDLMTLRWALLIVPAAAALTIVLSPALKPVRA